MPDDDWALGQNEVDVRNEARMRLEFSDPWPTHVREPFVWSPKDVRNEPRRARIGGDIPVAGRMHEGASGSFTSETAFPTNTADHDLAVAIDHLRLLNETPAINPDAEQRRQESITRTLDEIQRLMDG